MALNSFTFEESTLEKLNVFDSTLDMGNEYGSDEVMQPVNNTENTIPIKAILLFFTLLPFKIIFYYEGFQAEETYEGD